MGGLVVLKQRCDLPRVSACWKFGASELAIQAIEPRQIEAQQLAVQKKQAIRFGEATFDRFVQGQKL